MAEDFGVTIIAPRSFFITYKCLCAILEVIKPTLSSSFYGLAYEDLLQYSVSNVHDVGHEDLIQCSVSDVHDVVHEDLHSSTVLAMRTSRIGSCCSYDYTITQASLNT